MPHTVDDMLVIPKERIVDFLRSSGASEDWITQTITRIQQEFAASFKVTKL